MGGIGSKTYKISVFQVRIIWLLLLCNMHKIIQEIYKLKCNKVSIFEIYCVIFTIDAFGL